MGNEATFPIFMISWRQPLKKSTSSNGSSGPQNTVNMRAWAPTAWEDPRPNWPAYVLVVVAVGGPTNNDLNSL